MVQSGRFRQLQTRQSVRPLPVARQAPCGVCACGFDAGSAATAARDRVDEQIVVVATRRRFADSVNRLGYVCGTSALTNWP